MCVKNLYNPTFKEVKNSLLQELRGQFAADSCATPNLRLIMLPRTMKNHHFHVKPAGSASKNAPIANTINYLSINDNDDTENIDEHVVNSLRSYNSNRNARSNYRNNNRNNASNCCNNKRNNNNVSFNKSTNQLPFRGECHACNEMGHYSND